jgi:hypothetical protein
METGVEGRGTILLGHDEAVEIIYLLNVRYFGRVVYWVESAQV